MKHIWWAAVAFLSSDHVRYSAAQQVVGFDNTTFLDNSQDCESNKEPGPLQGIKLDPPGLVALVFILVLYMLYGLGLVVEKVLVPAIHVGISSRIKVPESVRSASLLSLGGCTVPLVFINLFSLTQEPASPIGIGVLLGSAAFNFLFVLPICYFLSDWEITPLYWWPLVRDLFFYLVGLSLVLLFFCEFTVDWMASQEERKAECWGGQEAICCYQAIDQQNHQSTYPVTEGVLMWWEGLIVLLVYVLYISVLKVHHKVKWAIDHITLGIKRRWCCTSFVEDLEKKRRSIRRREQTNYSEQLEKAQETGKDSRSKSRLRAPSAVSPGTNSADRFNHVLELVAYCTLHDNVAVHRLAALIVFRSKDAQEAFASLASKEDKLYSADLLPFIREHDAQIFSSCESPTLAQPNKTHSSEDYLEIAHALLLLMTKESEEKAFKDEFDDWYVRAEAKLAREANAAFDFVDEACSGAASVEKLAALLEFLGCAPSKRTIRKTREKLEIDAKGVISRNEFKDWYSAAMSWVPGMLATPTASQRQLQAHAQDLEGGPVAAIQDVPHEEREENTVVGTLLLWDPTSETILGYLFHFLGLPIRGLVILTTRCWSGPAEELSFMVSILWLLIGLAWIGLFSWILLFAAESISVTLNIPSAALGSTVLAIGINSLHFLNSVTRGIRVGNQGDKVYNIVRSLEHAIQGNVFDLLCGLPLAWILANLVKGRPLYVGASNILSSLWMLLLMVVLLLVLWISARWKLDIIVSSVMLILYVLFVVQDCLLADWSKPVPTYVLCDGCRSGMFCATY